MISCKDCCELTNAIETFISDKLIKIDSICHRNIIRIAKD